MAFLCSFMSFICFNGKLVPADLPVMHSDIRSFKYGDGVFETMKVIRGRIILEEFHFERLFASMELLKINAGPLTAGLLIKKIIELTIANNLPDNARIRLTTYRNNANNAEYIIEAVSLGNEVNDWNKEGWIIEVYHDSRKNFDHFSNLKTTSRLPYVMAEIYRKENGLDEALVLNVRNCICDGSKTNLFWVLNNDIYTPALQEGCIGGVMRRYIIEQSQKAGNSVKQTSISEEMLKEADEVFVSNAIIGLRWVKKFREKTYNHLATQRIYLDFIAPLF